MKNKKYNLKKISKKCKKILKKAQVNPKDDRYKKSLAFKKKYGFFHEECWNLDSTLAALILPRLIEFESQNVGCPSCFCKMDDNFKVINEEQAFEEWHNILKKMIDAFYSILFDDDLGLSTEEVEKNDEKIQEGLQLFAEYFRALWW